MRKKTQTPPDPPNASPDSGGADLRAALTLHLEFLGYSATVQQDGWVLAEHPIRPDFFVKPLPIGVRAVAHFALGPLSGEQRHLWLGYVNRCNDRGVFVRFALTTDEHDTHWLRAVALFPLRYEQRLFGALLDTWHREVDLALESRPLPAEVEDEAAGGEDGDPADQKTVTH